MTQYRIQSDSGNTLSTNWLSFGQLLKLGFFVIPTTIYLTLGSSCAGDIARLQSHLNEVGTGMLEPGSSFLLDSLTLFVPLLEVSIFHGFAHAMLCLYAYYFIIVRACAGRVNWLSITCFVISIFNPITFELVAHNSRQFFSFGLLMLATITADRYLISRQLRLTLLQNSGSVGEGAILKQSNSDTLKLASICLLFLISFTVHTTTPSVLLSGFLWAIITTILLKGKNLIGFYRSVQTGKVSKIAAFINVVLIGLIPIVLSVLISNGTQRLAIYFIEQNIADYKFLSFDTSSLTLLLSLVWILVFCFLLVPLKFVGASFKSLSLTLLLWIFLVIGLAYYVPPLSEILRRLYQPIFLLAIPLMLSRLIVTPLSTLSRYVFYFLLAFALAISLALQYQKLANSQVDGDTFYSLNNEMPNSCMLFRWQS